jgi:hypothetical protein
MLIAAKLPKRAVFDVLIAYCTSDIYLIPFGALRGILRAGHRWA